MKNILFISILFCCNLGAQAQTTTLQTTDELAWQKLAEIEVNFDVMGAEIPIYEKEKFASLHFRLGAVQLELLGADITFDNGEKFSVVLNQRLQPKQHSRILDLPGDRRILKSVAIRFKPIPRTDDRKATIQLWASKNKMQSNIRVKSSTTKGGAKTTIRKRNKQR